MKKNLYTLLCLMLFSAALSAQVTVTYKVDVTDYLATTALNANGIRIGGNFTDLGGTNGTDTLPNWAPSDPLCAMTDEGNNVWSIAVTYDAAVVGTTQQFKFVNGDWGTNEGATDSEIATGGCGSDDGAGNINRLLVIPAADVAYQWCWEKCTQCDGSSPLLSGIEDVSFETFVLNSYPNPAVESATLSFTLSSPASEVTLSVYNSLGQLLNRMEKSSQGTGVQNYILNTSTFTNGVYFYSLNVDGVVATNTMVVSK